MFRPIFGALTATMILAAPLPALSQEELSADTVVARVGDAEITMGHVLALRTQLPERVAQIPDDVLFGAIVDQLVDQHLLAEAVIAEGPLPRALELRAENEQRALIASSRIEELLAPAVTQEELQAAYDAAFAEFTPQKEYNASHILVETEEEALAIVEELNGGADFATLAQEKSTGPSGPNGGELGWFATGRMVPEFEQEVISLEPETISAPVETQFGWHVIRLNDVRDTTPPPLEAVADDLRQSVQAQRIADSVAELREATPPEILTEGIDPGEVRNDALLAE